MCAYLGETAVTGHGAILADVIVIADVDEPACEMVATQLLHGVVAVLASGGTVYDEIFHCGARHGNAALHFFEKLVLGGDDVATDGQGIGFRCHSLCTHEADVANAISVVINVMMALRMVCH